MGTLLINRKEALRLLDMREVIDVVEQAFKDFADGRAAMPAKTYVELTKGDFRAMPGALPGAAGIKWVNVHPANHVVGLPTVMGVFIYSDPDTGYPLAIMDATELTAYRTAACSACASRRLAKRNPRTMGLIGAGKQAHMHIMSHTTLFALKAIKVYDKAPEASRALAEHFPNQNIVVASMEDAAACDIVCTLTPAISPIVPATAIKPGTHINAVGADAAGKQELDPAILRTSRVIVDDIGQAVHGGEINVAISKGLFSADQVWADLGQIITGRKQGRENDRQVTVFDSTGLAIEDVATARIMYDRARQQGSCQTIELVDDIPANHKEGAGHQHIFGSQP